ncbi:MAG: hypothetical protein QOH79_520 [Acidimicrobiaceae bacterium]
MADPITVNYAEALRAVEEWLANLDKIRVATTINEHRKQLDDWFLGRVRLMQTIGRAFGEQPAAFERYAQVANPPWWGTRDAAIRVRGQILQAEERARIFPPPAGPRIQADQLHPTVWEAAKLLWSGGHRRAAIQAAGTAVDTQLQAKLNRYDKSGTDLVTLAFKLDPAKPGESRLRLPGYPTGSEAYKSAHQGAMNFGQGCMLAIRNIATHDLDEPSEQVALERLAALSVLARFIAEAEVEQAGP